MEGPIWPAWKFGLRQADVTKLARSYKPHAIPLQATSVFHEDLVELSHDSKTLQDLGLKLSKRRDERLHETLADLDHLAIDISTQPDLFRDDAQWGAAVRFLNTRSLQACVDFLRTIVSLPTSPTRSPVESKLLGQAPLCETWERSPGTDNELMKDAKSVGTEMPGEALRADTEAD